VIGTNSGRSASEFTYQMTGSVKSANKPLLMIGEGGGHFGEAIGSTVSWASTGNFSSAIMTVLDSTLSLFKTPKQITVPGTMQLTVYNPGAGGQAFYKSPYISYPTVQTLIQAQTNSVQYFSVTYESGKYGYFGYYDNVNAMTSTGKDFMVNLCYYIGKLSQ